MKKLLLISILVSCTGYSNADYFNPPQWQTSRDYSHQSWDFGNDEMTAPVIPLLPDGEPNYTGPQDANSKLVAVDYNVHPSFQYLIPYGLVGWKYEYDSVITNKRAFYGGMGNTSLTFKITNTLNTIYYWKKRIWVQSIFYARKDGVQPYDIEVARNQDFTDKSNITLLSLELQNLNDPNNPEGNLSRWYVLTARYEIKNISQTEYVKITSYQSPPVPNQHPGGASMFDRVDIDTRYYSKADFDESGSVDFLDFTFFAEQWLR